MNVFLSSNGILLQNRMDTMSDTRLNKRKILHFVVRLCISPLAAAQRGDTITETFFFNSRIFVSNVQDQSE
jgi:hypothetical protein